jgi:SAM-dependent methyltransferase
MTLQSKFFRMFKKPSSAESNLSYVDLNRWQEGFCTWNAERLSISIDESKLRYQRSWNSIKNGHAGAEYRDFCELSQSIYSVFFDDNQNEVYDAYQSHSFLHFLRMLSYSEPVWSDTHPIVTGFRCREPVTILDFGCGLAQVSISLAETLRSKGNSVRLFLADIPTIRKDFLAWFCQHLELPCEIADCTRTNPIPEFSSCHVCVATEIFEHLHDPLPYLSKIDNALLGGGFLITNINDHQPGFFHVSPNLSSVRHQLTQLGYQELKEDTLYQKQ